MHSIESLSTLPRHFLHAGIPLQQTESAVRGPQDGVRTSQLATQPQHQGDLHKAVNKACTDSCADEHEAKLQNITAMFQWDLSHTLWEVLVGRLADWNMSPKYLVHFLTRGAEGIQLERVLVI